MQKRSISNVEKKILPSNAFCEDRHNLEGCLSKKVFVPNTTCMIYHLMEDIPFKPHQKIEHDSLYQCFTTRKLESNRSEGQLRPEPVLVMNRIFQKYQKNYNFDEKIYI